MIDAYVLYSCSLLRSVVIILRVLHFEINRKKKKMLLNSKNLQRVLHTCTTSERFVISDSFELFVGIIIGEYCNKVHEKKKKNE